MSKTLTANSLIEQEDSIYYNFAYQKDTAIDTKVVKKMMIKFAREHVKAALKLVGEIPPMDVEIPYTGVRAGGSYIVKRTNKKAILKAYPLTNIK